MIKLYIMVGFILFIAWLIKNPTIKGMMGEFLVKLCLKNNLSQDIYRIINNVMILDNQGGTTQIDHLVLSPHGIFVVETKNMKGWIFGDKNADQWTQQIFKVKNKFQNPFRQNYKHIRCLAELTGIPVDMFTHVIVFVGKCDIKTRDKLPESLVTNSNELIEYIKSFTTQKISPADLDQIQNAILGGKVASTMKTRREHVAHVKEIVEEKSQQPPFCPRCGSPMIQRLAKTGDRAGKPFWGCTQYPKCRGTINE